MPQSMTWVSKYSLPRTRSPDRQHTLIVKSLVSSVRWCKVSVGIFICHIAITIDNNILTHLKTPPFSPQYYPRYASYISILKGKHHNVTTSISQLDFRLGSLKLDLWKKFYKSFMRFFDPRTLSSGLNQEIRKYIL